MPNPTTSNQKINTLAYIESNLMIRDKNAEIVPLHLNRPQRRLYDAMMAQRAAGKPIRVIVLKARQWGCSTLVEAIQFMKTATNFNRKAAIVSHQEKSTKALFEMNKLFYDMLPWEIKPATRSSNAYEISFDNKSKTGLKSSITCHTAGGQGIGRSETIQDLHISEYAFWPANKNEIYIGIAQAVPDHPDTSIVIESTANGFDDFEAKWEETVEGLNDFIAIFVPWYEIEEYQMECEPDFEVQDYGRYGNERELKNLYGLSNEQIRWRRWAIANKCGNKLDTFKQEYPSTPEEAFIGSGACVFDKEAIVHQIARARKIEPVATGRFRYTKTAISPTRTEITNIQWEDDPSGEIIIFEQPQLQKDDQGTATGRCPYVLGGDTAGEGVDWFTAKVVNNITQGTAARYRKLHADPDLYADQMYCLGMYYHEAMIGIESNFTTYPIRELEKAGYPNQYVRERMDTIENRIVKAYGFETNRKTKPIIVEDFVALAREDITIETDVMTLKEMLTFIKDENGLYHAQEAENTHDDLVMATCIAHFIGKHAPHTWMPIKRIEEGFISKNFNTKPTRRTQQGGYRPW